MARNMMSKHTDMQDKYRDHCYDIHPIQNQYKERLSCESPFVPYALARKGGLRVLAPQAVPKKQV